MNTSSDIIVIGGGLAGLTNAIDLRQRGYGVILVEKKEYPYHKVCGEYISNEVKPYLLRLGAFPTELKPKEIKRFEISSPAGKLASCDMKLGGFGISRYAFDHFLYQRAIELGVVFYTRSTANKVIFEQDEFKVYLNQGICLISRVVIGAYGKRSVLDKQLGREFFSNKTDYVGIKHHFKADFPDDLVALHNFEGGYCGLSKVENNHVNLCYLTTTKVSKRYKNIEELEREHLAQNPFLKRFLDSAEPAFEPLVISQVNFAYKHSVEDHILMSGDAAGLIHPLCGNGMAMAIHSAQICSELVDVFLQGKLSRTEMETQYAKSWHKAFRLRLRFGNSIQTLFGRPGISDAGVDLVCKLPGVLKGIVRLSHGRPIQ